MHILLVGNFKLFGFWGDLTAKIQESLLSVWIIEVVSVVEGNFNVKVGTVNSFAIKIKHRINR